ncbi:MAG: hypothetical protein U5S82_02750 [Gammaproteobacteria bacterium]|nr:hypothetical protein [Gammaproteobacteria bacterium]
MLNAILRYIHEYWLNQRRQALWDEWLDEGCIPVRRIPHPPHRT